MIWLYRLAFPFVLLALAPKYLLRMRRRGGYADGFWQRFGGGPALPGRRPGVARLWLQAVSVGELLAVEPILETLQRDGVEVILTTTTSTAYRLAREKYLRLVTAVGYFPVDWAPFSARAWRRIKPDLAIIAEGERWPEHMRQGAQPGPCPSPLHQCAAFRPQLRALAPFFRPRAAFVLGGIDRLLASSAQDARPAFASSGFPPAASETTGNLKLDVKIQILDGSARERLQRELGPPSGRRILLGSSTWPGEEEALIGALLAARASGVASSLLIVPRHAERRVEIEKIVRASGLAYHFRSIGAASFPVDIAVADTTGELRSLTQLADVVFVGKSLVPHTEGQTPVEAAVLGKPILMGAGMSNFRSIAANLVWRGAARVVTGPGRSCRAGDDAPGGRPDARADGDGGGRLAPGERRGPRANLGRDPRRTRAFGVGTPAGSCHTARGRA